MSFTLSTAPLLLLSAFILYKAKGRMLPVVMFMSIFQAASILNIGSGAGQLGISPSFLLLLIVLATKMLSAPERGVLLHPPLQSTAILLILFTSYATLSVFLNPILFRDVPFTNAKFGYLVPLQWNMSYLPQLVYLLLSVSLYFVAAYRTTPAELTKALDWYVAGAVFASLLAVYQFIGLKTGIPFPSDYLHTSPTYEIFEGYEINGFARMNSTFTEAAAAALCFTTALAIPVWRFLSGSVTLLNVGSATVIFIGLVLTISTTGYLCLAFIIAVGLLTYIFHWRGSHKARSNKLFLAIPAVILLIIVAVNPLFQEAFTGLIHTVILDKTQTFSYQDRTQINEDAIQTAAKTYWLGAGWGICRASSLLPTILGNVGIPGTLLFFLAIIQLFLPMLKRSGIQMQLHGAVLFALATVLLNLVISGPQVDFPILWLLFAIASRLASPIPSAYAPRATRMLPASIPPKLPMAGSSPAKNLPISSSNHRKDDFVPVPGS
jgi:hypothetical protein